MKGKKRPAKKVPHKSTGTNNSKVESAGGNTCVCCGKPVESGDCTVVVEARVHTRSFPVCSETCKSDVEDFVEKDKNLKKYMYLMILAAAVCILISAVTSSMQLLMYGGLAIAGLAFIIFPYPITAFETFSRCPIRKVTVICRCIGVFLVLFGAVLAFFA